MRAKTRLTPQLLLHIDDPEILKSPGAENSYIVFGKFNINDFAGTAGDKEIVNYGSKYQKPEKAEQSQAQDKPVEGASESKEAEDNETPNEEGLDAESIKMIMDHCKCSRSKAVRALREAEGDQVNAILVSNKIIPL